MALRFQHQRLVEARVGLGLTQERAAQIAGVDVRTYRRYESGEVNAAGPFAMNRASRRQIVHKLAAELGIAEEELVSDAAEPRPAGPGDHVLPRAVNFVGRDALLERLRGWSRKPYADAPTERIIALVGIGGAGKTSLVERALEANDPAPFVWSFYEDPRADAFFDALVAHFGEASPAGRGELADRATRAVANAGNLLLLIDGLEAVQATGETGRSAGELEDSRIRLFLRRVARGLGSVRALITSRVAIVDLAGWEGSGLTTLKLGPLSPEESLALLRCWGVRGSAAALAEVVPLFGGHALSIAVMGSYVGGLLGGDAAQVLAVDLQAAQKDDPLAHRLARLLDSYGRQLSPLDRDVLSRVCAFNRGLERDALGRMSRAGGALAGALEGASSSELRAAIARLVRAGLATTDGSGERFSAHPFVRRHFQRALGATLPRLHELERDRLSLRLDIHTHAAVEPGSLDLFESLFEHTLHAGHLDEAFELYTFVLRGFSRLGLELGELSRGLRLVRAFAADAAQDVRTLSAALPANARMRLAYDWGLYAAALGDLPAAMRCYEFSGELARANESTVAEATSLRARAYTHRLRAELDTAEGMARSSIALCIRADAVEARTRGVALLGAIQSDMGRLELASATFAEARALGDVPVARRALWEAEHWIRTRELDRARAATEANLAMCQRADWRGHAAHCHSVLGLIDCEQGDLTNAARRLADANAWCKRAGEVEMLLRAADLDRRIAEKAGRSVEAIVEHARELATLGGFRCFGAFV